MAYMSEADMRVRAQRISQEVAISNEDGNYKGKVKSTKAEARMIYEVAYGALLAMNFQSWKDREAWAILDSAEFTFNIMDRKYRKRGRGYETLYIPLNNIRKEMRKEA